MVTSMLHHNQSNEISYIKAIIKDPHMIFLISNFHHVLNVVCSLLGNLPASADVLHTPTCLWRWNRVFRNVCI